MTNSKNATNIFETALGWIAIETSDSGVVRTTLPEPRFEDALEAISDGVNPLRLASLDASPFCSAKGGGTEAGDAAAVLEMVKDRLVRYCAGEDVGFDDIPIQPNGWTDLTKRARKACQSIPRGETRTYAWLAERASGSRKTARAAARAMATNPLPLIIPCHRVVGSDGKLRGFGGSVGIPLKARLLEMEGVVK